MKSRKRKRNRGNLPEVVQTAEITIPIRNQRIPLQEIQRSLKGCADLVDSYQQKVLSQKTRTIRLLGRKCSAKILNTLLGYEVQAYYKRIQCPDLVTARYIKLFSELGCRSIQLPYDPTLTAELISEFETKVMSITEQIRLLFPHDPAIQQYVEQRLFRSIRQQLRVGKAVKATPFPPEESTL